MFLEVGKMFVVVWSVCCSGECLLYLECVLWEVFVVVGRVCCSRECLLLEVFFVESVFCSGPGLL